MATGQPTPEPGTAVRIVRFAAFEFDLETGELRKHGLRIKLQGQPIQVLAILIKHAGEVVTREDLQKHLWPVDTYVDFEHSLNAAIKRLRAALGDSADVPRYVETLPRQGYRFVAPLIYPVPPAVPHPPAAKKKTLPRLAAMAAAAVLLVAVSLWLQSTEYFWRNPLLNARHQTVTDSSAVEHSAAISRDGHFIAFLSDRDGQTDVWVTQVGSGQFHNLTRGNEPQLINPSVRTLGFSPDASQVTFWVRKGGSSGDIGIWSAPTLGGDPKPYLEGVAESNWSADGARLAYHTPGPGDPLFIAEGARRPEDRSIFTAPAGLHSHFPLWSPDGAFIYFVQGTLPDRMDIWRISPAGGRSERITSHNAPVSYPVMLDRRTLMYIADPDGSGPGLYSADVERRIPHRLTTGLDLYTSLDSSADGRRLVATRATAERTLWRVPVSDSDSTPVQLKTKSGFAPRLGPDYLLYISTTGSGESISKVSSAGTAAELWSAPDAQILGGPAISPDGRNIAFSVRQRGQSLLYSMQSDGAKAKIVADSLDLQGSPAWCPDGRSITSAATDHGATRLFRIPLDNTPPVRLLEESSLDPAWSPDGAVVVYSGPDIGTTFPLRAATAAGANHPMQPLTLTRGARHTTFLGKGTTLVFLRGDLQHKDLWTRDLLTGEEHRLTSLAPGFNIRDFDISPDGREAILERVQDRSDVVLLDLPQR